MPHVPKSPISAGEDDVVDRDIDATPVLAEATTGDHGLEYRYQGW